MNIQSAIVRANDKGALDCVVKARVQAAILRAIDETHFKWEVEKLMYKLRRTMMYVPGNNPGMVKRCAYLWCRFDHV
ncbi:hypothetical protein GCM10020331_006270 [Ectobacillus funiculus]